MADRRQFEGKDVQEALRAASDALGIPEERLSFGVLDSPRRGIFGIGKRVRIWAEAAALEKRFVEADSSAETVEWVASTLRRIVELMSFDVHVAAAAEVGGVRAELTGADHQLLVQEDGQLLDALQFLVNRIASRSRPGMGRVRLECAGFRRERDEDLIELAREAARQVELSGKSRWLPPLNPYERRLVHLTIEEFSGLSSSSSGEGFLKRIRINPNKPAGEA